jgi:hypothetical protein
MIILDTPPTSTTNLMLENNIHAFVNDHYARQTHQYLQSYLIQFLCMVANIADDIVQALVILYISVEIMMEYILKSDENLGTFIL